MKKRIRTDYSRAGSQPKAPKERPDTRVVIGHATPGYSTAQSGSYFISLLKEPWAITESEGRDQ